jgi:CHAD domain-containing protein
MDQRLDLHRPVGDELRRIADELLADAQRRADEPEYVEDAVHEVRKRCKETRGLIRLVRGASERLHQRENAAVRDAARLLSEARDSTAAVETYDALHDAFGAEVVGELDDVRSELEARRDRIHEQQDAVRLLAQASERIGRVRARIPSWSLDAEGFDALAGGLGKTYGRARRRMDDAAEEPTSERWHEWRKRVKYHRYHVALLQEVWPAVLAARREEVHRLTDLLGDDHDLAVLREDAVEDLTGRLDDATLRAFLALVDRRRAELQSEALPLGRRLFAEEPDGFVARTRQLYDAALAEPEAPAAADPVVAPGA